MQSSVSQTIQSNWTHTAWNVKGKGNSVHELQLSQSEFPEVNPAVTNPTLNEHRQMPKVPRKPTQRVRFTCDADDMSMTELEKLIVPDEDASVDKC